MKFRFTIGGLFLLTTIIAILVTIGLWIAKSALFTVVFFYLLIYLGVFTVMYLVRYRRQFREARAAWNALQLARAAQNESLASLRASHTEQSLDPPPGETP